jgi:hypothetical protein
MTIGQMKDGAERQSEGRYKNQNKDIMDTDTRNSRRAEE